MIHDVIVEKTSTGFRTHGLEEEGMKDIALNLTLPDHLATSILVAATQKLRNHELAINDVETEITTCPLFVKETPSSYLIIFPDEFLRFPWESNCSEVYKSQIA